MRVLALALASLALAAPARAGGTDARVAYVHQGQLVVLDVATGASQVVLQDAPLGPVAWSGDGRLVSDGGRIAGGPDLPTDRIAWAPDGETAAYLTHAGAVALWTPAGGTRTILPAPWGARSLAWGAAGELAIGRKQVRPGKGFFHQEVWIWRAGALRRVVGPITVDTTPIVEGFAPDGSVLWWNDRFDSASAAADGLTLFANRRRLGATLIYKDFVHVCGSHLVFAQGHRRETTKDKSIVYDGHDVSHDTALSWVSPSCNGSMVVAAAGRNWWEPGKIGSGELRSIWELVPRRERLTRPPRGWTDEFPTVLPDGSVLFVRTRQTWAKELTTLHASLDLWREGTVTPLASLTTTVDPIASSWLGEYFCHYGWPDVVAVAP
jgi:hypothetical protein